MALTSNRAGVRRDQVDIKGRPISNYFFNNLLNDLPAWTDLPVWVNGLEQLLPVNDDEPDTSPIKCNITYPIADEKTGQYFTYRKSPTQKDGLAKIRDIKGNTLVWNQLIQNGDFSGGTTRWSKGGGASAFSVSHGVCTVIANTGYNFDVRQSLKTIKNHVYYGSYDAKSDNIIGTGVGLLFQQTGAASSNTSVAKGALTTSFQLYEGIATMADDAPTMRVSLGVSASSYTGETFQVKNVFLVDLTLMFGAGNEPTTVKEFTDLFPLPYYKYNAGSLLNFVGTKLKTVGKNLLNSEDASPSSLNATLTKSKGSVRIQYTGGSRYIGFNFFHDSPYFNGVFLPLKYRISFDVKGVDTSWAFGLRSVATNNFTEDRINFSQNGHFSGVIDARNLTEDYYLSVSRLGNKTSAFDVTFSNIQIEIGETESAYTDYVTNETDLPISTFFPTGMKSAVAVYDELTPTRAITRVGSFTFNGTEDWVMESQGDGAKNFYIRSGNTRPDDAKKNTYNGIVASKDFHWRSSASDLTNVVYSGQSSGLVQVRVDPSLISNIDVTKWKTYLTSNPITVNYELAAEIVQPTMSFDTE